MTSVKSILVSKIIGKIKANWIRSHFKRNNLSNQYQWAYKTLSLLKLLYLNMLRLKITLFWIWTRRGGGEGHCTYSQCLLPLAVNRHLKLIKYWLKIITRKTNLLVYNLYIYQYERCELEHVNNWASKVRKMLNNLVINYACINQNVQNTFSFFKLCNQRLKDQFFSKWNTSMSR